jgi:hypothetical protein
MSKFVKFMDFIPKFNQVIFFLGSVSVLLFLSAIFIRELISSNGSNTGLQVLKTKLDKDVFPQKTYFMSIKDVHIFKVTSKSIYLAESNQMSEVASLYGGNYREANVVNLLFSSENGTKLKLFESDRLITRIEPARFNKEQGYPVLNKHLYSVVSQDNNSDGYLNKDDRVDLYVSDYDGRNLKLIHENIKEIEIIEDNKIMITGSNIDNGEFFIYDLASGINIKLDVLAE